MKSDIHKRFILLKIDEKKTVNLYTLIDVETGDKVISIGVKEVGLSDRDLVDVILSVKSQSEKFDTKDGVRYVDVLHIFASKISKVSI